MELIVYAVLFVAVVLAVGAAVALKRHPEILARLTAVEQKLAGHQPVVVNNILPAAPSAPAADFSPATPAGQPIPVAKPAGPPAPAVPVALPPGGNTTDPTAPGFIPPAPTAAPAPEPVAPAIDTSGPVLDFARVGGGVAINLNGAKTIENCPTPVRVAVNVASGQTGATNTYDVTVNGVTTHNWVVGNEFTATVGGPTITVSVSCPGLQMLVRGAL